MRIISKDHEVRARLTELLGVTPDEIFQIVKEVVGARADAVEDDPIFTPGMFGHIHGVRNTRGLMRTKGWVPKRKDNMELVVHPDLMLSLGFQNVDLAASETHVPQAISGKGKAAQRAIEEAQGSFMSLLDGDTPTTRRTGPILAGLWHLCVSVQGDDVRAEVSLSTGLSGGNFDSFIERIFVVKKGDWDDFVRKTDNGEDAVDFVPLVKKKKR